MSRRLLTIQICLGEMAVSTSQLLYLTIFFISGTKCTSYYKDIVFSTTTPYFWIKDSNESITVDSGMTMNHLGKTCNAFYVDAFLRHGARYPTLHYLQDINAMQAKLKKTSAVRRHPFLDTWVNPFHYDMASQLSNLGKSEHYTLGKRFLARYHSLLREASDRIVYYASSKKRTQDSIKYFQQGVTGRSFSDDISSESNPVIDDIMLRFFDNCKEYSKRVKNNKTAIQEYYDFKHGPEMNAVVQAVNSKLSGGEFNLTVGRTNLNILQQIYSSVRPNAERHIVFHEMRDDVTAILKICSTEIGLFKTSSWCDFFTQEDLEVLDYSHDIYNFWLKAYGYPIDSKISCPIFADVFRAMDDAIQASDQRRRYVVGTFRVGHAETLLPIYSALSLYKDSSKLLASNFKSQRNRKFRSSLISPFSANIHQVLYRCGDTPEDIFIKVFINEEEVTIPACQGHTCPYFALKNFYRDAISNCRFDQICHNTKPSVSPVIVG